LLELVWTFPVSKITLLVIEQTAELAPLVAVIVAVPTANGVTSPDAETEATEGALLVHVTCAVEGVTVNW
jgi:hypothetical protein